MEVHQRIRRVCRTSNIQEVDHKKEARRLARALKIFKIVCQAELQPRHYPPPPPLLPLPRQNLSRANGVTGSCGTHCATWREERERERERRERRQERGKSRRTRTATTTTTTTIPGTCVEPEICRRGLDGTSRRVPTTEYVHPVRTLHPRLTLRTLPLVGATLVAPPPATPGYPPRDSSPKYRGCAPASFILTWSADTRCTLRTRPLLFSSLRVFRIPLVSRVSSFSGDLDPPRGLCKGSDGSSEFQWKGRDVQADVLEKEKDRHHPPDTSGVKSVAVFARARSHHGWREDSLRWTRGPVSFFPSIIYVPTNFNLCANIDVRFVAKNYLKFLFSILIDPVSIPLQILARVCNTWRVTQRW